MTTTEERMNASDDMAVFERITGFVHKEIKLLMMSRCAEKQLCAVAYETQSLPCFDDGTYLGLPVIVHGIFPVNKVHCWAIGPDVAHDILACLAGLLRTGRGSVMRVNTASPYFPHGDLFASSLGETGRYTLHCRDGRLAISAENTNQEILDGVRRTDR